MVPVLNLNNISLDVSLVIIFDTFPKVYSVIT